MFAETATGMNQGNNRQEIPRQSAIIFKFAVSKTSTSTTHDHSD